jgi:hypothetical protein
VHALRRTEAAGLRVGDGTSPEQLEALAADGRLAEAIRPVGELLPMPGMSLAPEAAWRFAHGSAQPIEDGTPGRVKVFDEAGQLIGVGSLAGGELRPEKVLPPDAGA